LQQGKKKKKKKKKKKSKLSTHHLRLKRPERGSTKPEGGFSQGSEKTLQSGGEGGNGSRGGEKDKPWGETEGPWNMKMFKGRYRVRGEIGK